MYSSSARRLIFKYFCTEALHFNEFEDGNMPEYIYTDSVAACSLMVKRCVIDKIGFMPEENFLYWDDTEWCYRCNLAGYKVASVGNAKALHAMGAKNESVNTFPTYYAWRNWIVFFTKYVKEEELGRMAETFLGSVFQVIYEGIHNGSENRAKTVMLAYDDAIHGIMGKAGENRIFNIDFNAAPFLRLFMVKKKSILKIMVIPTQQNGWKNLPLSTDIILHGLKNHRKIYLLYQYVKIYSSLMI